MGRKIRATTEGSEALAAATAETILQGRGITTAKYQLVKFRASCDQQVTTEIENVAWRLLYQTTDGTGTGATELQGDPDDPTPNGPTMLHSFTAEPTAGTVIDEGFFPANGEMFEYVADGDGIYLDAATSSRIGIELTASAVVNARASMVWDPVTG